MLLLDVLDVLDNLSDEQRELILPQLFAHLSDVSLITIMECQFQYHPDKGSYSDFIFSQNEIIKQCVEIETSPFGNVFRRRLNLPPLSLRREIEL